MPAGLFLLPLQHQNHLQAVKSRGGQQINSSGSVPVIDREGVQLQQLHGNWEGRVRNRPKLSVLQHEQLKDDVKLEPSRHDIQPIERRLHRSGGMLFAIVGVEHQRRR